MGGEGNSAGDAGCMGQGGHAVGDASCMGGGGHAAGDADAFRGGLQVCETSRQKALGSSSMAGTSIFRLHACSRLNTCTQLPANT